MGRWMISNKLKLNDDKMELIVFSSKFRPRPSLSNVQIWYPIKTETLNLNTLGNKKFSKRDCDMIKLRLQGKHGEDAKYLH